MARRPTKPSTAQRVPNVNVRDRVPQAAIDDVVRQIVARFRPRRIVLFGSYAEGQPRPDSDVDLLVVLETSLRETEQAVQICQAIEYHFGLDLIVRTPRRWLGGWPSATLSYVTSLPAGKPSMHELTSERIEKAEGDYATAGRELRARRRPNCDAARFHAQQTAEKYLEAYLHEFRITVPRTHSLIDLLELSLTHDPDFELQRAGLVLLERSGSSISRTRGLTAGERCTSMVVRYDGPSLNGKASTAPAEVIDLGGAVRDLCLARTGSAPRRPHMLVFNGGEDASTRGNTHAGPAPAVRPGFPAGPLLPDKPDRPVAEYPPPQATAPPELRRPEHPRPGDPPIHPCAERDRLPRLPTRRGLSGGLYLGDVT